MRFSGRVVNFAGWKPIILSKHHDLNAVVEYLYKEAIGPGKRSFGSRQHWTDRRMITNRMLVQTWEVTLTESETRQALEVGLKKSFP